MNDNAQDLGDSYLKLMKESLSASAVLKAQLASLKSSCSISRVFAYEGVSDKVIYYHWISKVKPDLDYEPFVCKSKNQLLQLFDLLQKDLTGLSDDVYFFADRDFDELKGRTPTGEFFLTEKYSVENYLVDVEILAELLKIEFHCHGSTEVRANVVELFESMYDEFLTKTADINFRIYVARVSGISQIGQLPDRISELAEVQLDRISAGRGELRSMVLLDREPTASEVEKCTEIFKTLAPRSRYRGKFALHFFMKWLSLLLTDRNSSESAYFRGLPQSELVAKGPFSFEVLAAKSKPPLSFQRFLASVT
jgi:hypothetical protein